MTELEDNLNAYMNGSISFLTYRERRAGLIKHFVDSAYLPDDTIPLNHINQSQIKNAVLEEINKKDSLDTNKLSINNNVSEIATKQYIGLAVLVVIAALTWYFSTLDSSNTSNSSSNNSQLNNNVAQESLTSSTEKSPKPDSATNKNYDKKFVKNFLAMDQWNSDTLSEFLVKWQALSRLEKKQTKQSQSFIRLKNSLRLRILEQQALQSVKNKKAERQENLLIWFASQLSIPVS